MDDDAVPCCSALGGGVVEDAGPDNTLGRGRICAMAWASASETHGLRSGDLNDVGGISGAPNGIGLRPGAMGALANLRAVNTVARARLAGVAKATSAPACPNAMASGCCCSAAFSTWVF